MYSNQKKRNRKRTIVSRVTRWYTVFVAAIFIAMFSVALVLSDTWSSYTTRTELERTTIGMASDLDDFESYDDGVYFAIYSKDKKLERGTLPQGFHENAPFSSGEISKYSSDGLNYYYFDTYNKEEQKWVRGIHSIKWLSYELKLFLLAIVVLAPLSMISMSLGGRRILKRGLLPINDVTNMAEDITESRDYTKRINTSYKHSYDETARLANVFNKMIFSIQENFDKEKQFNQNVSHELRTPLSVIMAESEFGAKYADDLESARESLEVINHQAKLMKDMTEQILELSKAEQLCWSDLDRLSLSELVTEYCRQHERKWVESGLKFDIEIQSDIWIYGHKLMLYRVLDNLVSNAIKFSKTMVLIKLERDQGQGFGENQKNISFKCEKPEEITDLTTATLKVVDDGIGISPDHIAKISDRFYQVDESRNKEINSGLGLGLSFVREIAELHRAEFKIVSEEGDGAEFRLKFIMC